jgi:CheY-like chemotaxis protein
MATTTKKQIGNLLVEAGIISVKTLERSLEAQKGSGKRLGTLLREMGIVTEEEVLSALAKQSNLRIIRNFAQHSFDRELLARIPARLALEKIVFPLKVSQNVMAVATLDPYDHETFDQLAAQTSMKIHPVLATRDDILDAVRRHYPVGRWAMGGRQKVVLIDPSPMVAKFLQPPLEKEGYEVIACQDGIDGLKLAYSCHPDVILCDMMMPRMDSYMFMYALKTHPDTVNIPVILMSAKNSAEDEHRARKAGFFDILLKPAMPVRVLVSIKKALATADGTSPMVAKRTPREMHSPSPPPRSMRNLLRTRHGGM